MARVATALPMLAATRPAWLLSLAGIALVPASAATLHPEGVAFRSIGAFR